MCCSASHYGTEIAQIVRTMTSHHIVSLLACLLAGLFVCSRGSVVFGVSLSCLFVSGFIDLFEVCLGIFVLRQRFLFCNISIIAR